MRRIIILSTMFGLMLWTPSVWGAQDELLQVSIPDNTAKVSYQPLEEGKILVSVTDAQDNPVLGLTADFFNIQQGPKTAKIESIEPLATSKEVGLNIVMLIDNSLSMRMREAITPLKEALEAFYKTVRPIDNVTVVVFDDRRTTRVDGKALHAIARETGNVSQLRSFISDRLDDNLTDGTYLYDAMLVGLDQVRQMPQKANKFMVVFSDGQDLNSSVKRPDVEKGVKGLKNLSVYAVDYMPSAETDKFLSRFATNNGGRIWKAGSASSLLPVFEAFSSTLLHRYILTYRFLEAPKGTLAFGTPELTIEELTTIDSAPLLNYIFFETGQSEISDRYQLFERESDTAGFAEENLRGAMEKYRHVLNIIGSRLKNNPDADIRIVGCNSNTGGERGRTDLSLRRAESVRAYLRYVWAVDPQRITVEHRNLPAAPSTNRIPEGQAENQRVEIYSDHPALLDTVNSEYVQNVSEQEKLQILPQISSEAGIDQWKVTLSCGEKTIQTFEGQGDLPSELVIPLEAALLEQMTTCDTVRSSIEASDKEANVLNGENAGTLPVRFVQRKEQMAQVQGYRVKEQYALILFDYDSAAIKARNQIIVNRIIERIRKIPDAFVSIVGHTDSIGSEEYNLNLSQKRAEAVKKQIMETAAPLAKKLYVTGAGPHDPLYDNDAPEGRALNRTVTVTLEYLQQPNT